MSARNSLTEEERATAIAALMAEYDIGEARADRFVTEYYETLESYRDPEVLKSLVAKFRNSRV
ncbi:hypothetical protein KW784_02245 [Candidatus Parcubacteria bacterium]|nr:hypothetical protein [Candidatus Parcubacteria bacterium]